ncbi:hypothetical protein SAMN04515665_1143 [Blastococcus sp. DSM 46786]|nr:hypothetical protein SAMN04515665_1143 [Blastococcus sp. DSM 46786]
MLAAAAEPDAAARAGSRLCAQAEGIRGPVPSPGSPTSTGSGPR